MFVWGLLSRSHPSRPLHSKKYQTAICVVYERDGKNVSFFYGIWLNYRLTDRSSESACLMAYVCEGLFEGFLTPAEHGSTLGMMWCGLTWSWDETFN